MIGVYGANGFIGRHVVNGLLEKGHQIKAISRKFDPLQIEAWQDRVELVEADFSNSLAMLTSVQGLDTVVQLISSSSPGMGNQVLVDDIHQNVVPHVNFIQQAIAAGVKRYIFISSGGTVYGPKATVPTAESHHTNPINSHGMTKLVIEKYLQMFSRVDGLNHIILRVSNPYGPGQVFKKGQGLIPAILQRHRAGLPIQILGDGTSERDYIYIDDLVDAVEKSATLEGVENEVFNVGKGEGLSILDVISSMETQLGTVFEKEFLPARSTDVKKSILDISKAKRRLSWSPDTTFDVGLKQMLIS